jgi:NADH-quinone oxidoreductase subunit G
MSTIERNNQKLIKVTIDGKEIETTYGKTILEVARENDIYIPTMCYLTKVEPIASCRMCVVEVEGVDGMILSCQEKAVNGAVITTKTQELESERESIMKLYDVNHPLECGVCDKSGECDLQNKTLEYNLSEQSFSAKDMPRPVQNWGFIDYDPSLCIMCEKCVRVCNEIVGSEQLQISAGGYKSTIVNTKPENDCISCGECMAVCPVGALTNSNFKYSSNAWELNKVPSTCAMCSSGCELTYESKHESIQNSEHKIYRVTNNYEFSSLCGAGRFGFDYENADAYKDISAFNKAVDAFKDADSIVFSSYITNEEALMLNNIAKVVNAKLICPDATGFSRFLNAYKKASGNSLWSATQKSLSSSDAIVVLGSRLKDDAPMVKNHIAMASKRQKAKVVYMHPIEDSEIQNIITKFVKYEPGSEEAILALLLELFTKEAKLPSDVKSFVDELDIGYLSAESSVSEEELDAIELEFWKRKRFTLVVGEDIFNHPRVENIAKILAAIEKFSNYKLLVIPPASNTLGVSLICDLANEVEGKSVGYNAPADFSLSALGCGDLDMPALNQQEGTIVTIDRRVTPLNAALGYDGYILNDIAKELGVGRKYTIDLTKELPVGSGFKDIDFDSLDIKFSPLGDDLRGYELSTFESNGNFDIQEVEELPSYDGVVVYCVNSAHNRNPFTQKAKLTKGEAKLVASKQFAAAAKVQDGDKVEFEVDGKKVTRVFSIDTSLKGTFALNPTFDMGLSAFAISSYRFNRIKIKKVGSANE